MKLIEANKIAKEFVDSFGEVVLGFKYKHSELKEYSTKYYADLEFLKLDEVKTEESPLVGGACGFAIDKESRKVTLLSFGEYAAFQQHEFNLEGLYQQLINIKSGDKKFSQLKTRYNFSSKDLLRLKRMLPNLTIEKESVFRQLDILLKA